MAATAILKNRKIAISGPRFKVKLKREVELLQYGCLLFHSAGNGFVQTKLSENCKYKCKKNSCFITTCRNHN